LRIDILVRRFGPELRLVIILNTDSIIHSKKIMHLLMLPVMRKLGNTLILFSLNIAAQNGYIDVVCPRSGQTKDYEIGIGCFSTKYAALRGNNKNWLVSELK
jgi:hypothetical protein